eukprot:Ihof_evm2s429 gene=Ihof_evmTU2s429
MEKMALPVLQRSLLRASRFSMLCRGLATATAAAQGRKKLVIVGTGWAGTYMAKFLNPDLYDMTVVSLRNHMIFTPLLPQTTTGTLEFRAICEPITNAQPALTQSRNGFIPAMVHGVDTEKKELECVSIDTVSPDRSEQWFKIPYDTLVLAYGARPNTFGIPGVEKHAHFLREVSEARAIRRHILRNMGLASIPSITDAERKRLMHVVVVGGGPAGVEFAGDLSDFINDDLKRICPSLREDVKVTVIEAKEVLGNFEPSLKSYAFSHLSNQGIQFKKSSVKEVRANEVELMDGDIIPYGVMVWSTGVGPSHLTKRLGLELSKDGRVAVNKHMHAYRNGKEVDGVYAVGDCAGFHSSLNEVQLPCLAAVATRQARYLAKMLNDVEAKHVNESTLEPFEYKSLGYMASLGSRKALVDLKGWDYTGFRAWLTWRSAYLTMQGSMRSRLYVAAQWFAIMVFG